MAKIINQSAADDAEEWELGSFTLSIGAHPDDNIFVDGQKIEQTLAAVGFGGGQYFVENLGAAGLTQVNGVAVQRAALNHGDVVTVGPTRLLFLAPEQLAPRPALSGAAEPERRFKPAAPINRGAGPNVMAPSDINMLDELVGSIRSHRDRERREREEAQAQLAREWDKAVRYAEQLKAKVSGDPRVKYFEISRRSNDVIIRVQREPALPVQFLQMSMEHPEQKNHALAGVWLRYSGEPDRCHKSADEAVAELIRYLAFLIA